MPRNVNPLNKVPFGQEKTRAEFLARAAWEYDQASRLRSARHPIGYQALAEGHERAARDYEKAAKERPAKTVTHSTSRRTRVVAHATKARSKTSDKINIDQLAKMFDLPDWDKIDEMNQQHYWEMTQGGDYEDEDARMEAEQAAQTEVYNQWYDAVEHAASKLFEEHGLELEPTGKQGTSTRRYDFKIVPRTSWDAAANNIRGTINGVGTFHTNNLHEFLRSGPYTAREAVLSHLGYIKRYPEVYGSTSARRLYDSAW